MEGRTTTKPFALPSEITPLRVRPDQLDSTCLGKSVTLLVQNILDSDPWFIAPADMESLRNIDNARSIANAVIQGFQKAGLYQTLTKVDENGSPSFTINDLRNNAQTIDDAFPNETSGLYFRYYETGAEVDWWSPHTKYLYVGQGIDLKACEEQYCSDSSSSKTQGRHSALVRQAKLCEMRVLCVLPNDVGVLRLAEQILICLFQTYRHEMFDNTQRSQGAKDLVDGIEKGDHIEVVRHAHYFDCLMNKVGEITGWTGAVKRSDFGLSRGANRTSPLGEKEFPSQSLYLRSEYWVMDETTDEPIVICSFRRGRMALFHSQVNETSGASCFSIQLSAYPPLVLSAACDAKLLPPEGTPYQVVIEVRNDWSPHPRSYARLAQIGPYENWDRANSFAVCIQWESTPGGKFQTLYLEHGAPNERLHADKPGSFSGYATGIRVIDWLYRETCDYHNDTVWIPKNQMSANVVQVSYDFVHQTIKLEPAPTGVAPPLSGKKRHPEDVAEQMKRPEYGLSAYPTSLLGQQTRCDTCTLTNTACNKKSDDSPCDVCKSFGRPFCTLSDGILTAEELEKHPTAAKLKRHHDLMSSLYLRPFNMSHGPGPVRMEMPPLSGDAGAMVDATDEMHTGEEPWWRVE